VSRGSTNRPGLIELGLLDDRETARLAARTLGWISVVALAGGLMLAASRRPVPGLHPWGLVGASACGLAGTAVLVLRPRLMPARRLPVLVIGATLLLAFAAFEAGASFFPYVVTFYACAASGALQFLPRRWALVHLASGLLACAVVLAIQPGHWDGLAEFTLLTATIVVAAAVVDGVVARVTAAALAERALRGTLEEANARLATVNTQQRDFLARISHELRTPLNVIVGFSELLAEKLYGPLNEKQADYIGDIRGSARHLVGLIDEVLDVRRVESGRLELASRTVVISELVAEVATLFRDQADRRGVALVLDVRSPGAIEGDEGKLRQVLVNLVGNALKFTPAGGRIEVRATRHPPTPPRR
jgi:signal transduction histidine kinase